MAVPGSYNDQGEDTALRDHYGWAFYQKMVTLPALCAGQRVVLRFGAVTHKAKVWLDGRLIAAHSGGFLPFEADVTGLLAPGAAARLTVACDNRVDHSTLPVGNEPGQIRLFPAPTTRASPRWSTPRPPQPPRTAPTSTFSTMRASTARCGSTPPRRTLSGTSRWRPTTTAAWTSPWKQRGRGNLN